MIISIKFSYQNTPQSSADPWAAFGSSGVLDTDANAVDLFAKDAFMPNSNTNNAMITTSKPEKKASKLIVNPSVKVSTVSIINIMYVVLECYLKIVSLSSTRFYQY